MNRFPSLARPYFPILLCIIFSTFDAVAQNMTGLWTGKIYTTDKTLPYEVAISEKDGKLSGFSYTTFNVKGEEMVAVKSVVLRKEKDKYIIEDEDLVFNSFDEESPKQLKQTNTMELEIVNDKTMILVGKFKTLKTKEFRSLSGGVRLRKDSIIEQPRLIAKLEEMDLSKNLSFLQPPTPPEDLAKLEKTVAPVAPPVTIPKETMAPAVVKTNPNIAKANVPAIKPSASPTAVAKPVTPSTRPATPPPPAVRKPAPVVAAAKPAVPPKPATPVPQPTAVPPKRTETRVAANAFASNVGGRTIETIQTVAFKSDSITLTLYDNGEVDGDTVSVLLNGKNILSKQRLSTNAINYTVHITPELGDSLQLIMYAENLGALPPNTGLLIIKDGRDRYEIRFAGDLTKNAAITLRRKQP